MWGTLWLTAAHWTRGQSTRRAGGRVPLVPRSSEATVPTHSSGQSPRCPCLPLAKRSICLASGRHTPSWTADIEPSGGLLSANSRGSIKIYHTR